MNTQMFSGTGVALVTPFTAEGKVDDAALARLLWRCTVADFFVVLGSTGEASAMTAEERAHIIQTVVQRASGQTIVVGMGGNNTAELVNTLKNTDFNGVAAILSVVPYYNKPSQAGIIAHFKEIAANSPVPVILYNIPGRTGVNMTAETTLELAKVENIIGIKEASSNMMQIMQILAGRPKDFVVLSGDDATALPLMAVGADGVISVAANAFPQEMCEMTRRASAGHFAQAQQFHYRLLPFFEAVMTEGNPAGIKAALHKMGLIENKLRLPLAPVSDKANEQIAAAIKHVG